MTDDSVLWQPGRTVPQLAAEHVDHAGGVEVLHRLRCHPRCQQCNEHGRCGENVPRGDADKPIVGQCGERRPDREPEHAADEKRGPRRAAGEDAVEEQHDFRALAQHRKSYHHDERGHRPLARAHRRTDRGHLGCHLAAVARHPDRVPHQHHHGGAEHAGVEQFLARTFERVGDGLGEQGDDAGTERAEEHAGRNPVSAAADAAGRSQHDADDQTGLDHFAEDDDERAEHAAIPRL